MKKDKILFIVQLPPPIHGASIMNKSIIESAFINEAFEVDSINLDFASSIKDIGAFGMKKFYKAVLVAFKLFSKLLLNNYKLAYLTLSPFGGAFYRDLIYVSILKMFGTKIVYHLHGKGINDHISNRLTKGIYKFAFNRVDVICLSDMLVYDFKQVFTGQPYILANGIKANNEKTPDSKSDNTITFVYLSNFVESKGIKIFLEAINMLKKSEVEYCVKIIGNSADITVEQVNEYVKRNELSNIVEVLGPKYGIEKEEILSNSDIFVFPTFYKNECFPLVILEAMSKKLAVISTNNGAIEEIIQNGHNGVIIDKDMQSPKELMEAMRKLISNKELINEMKCKNFDKFNQNYSFEIFEKNFIKIMKNIVE